MKSAVRVGCVGAGRWGENLVRNFNDLGALGWICESDRERRAELSGQYPGVTVTGDLDLLLAVPAVAAVAIATPAESHGRQVRQALLAGKDVLVEKPLCLSAIEGRELVDLAAARERVLMVGHLLWYHPAVLKLQELVQSGALGRLQYIYSNRLNLGRIRREENILWSFAPHDISVILGLVGEMPDGVWAQGGNYLHRQIADTTVSLFTFPSGVRAHVFVSWLHPFKEQKLVLVGDRQMAVFTDTAAEKLHLYPHSIDWQGGRPVPHRAEALPVPCAGDEPLRAECAHFLACVRTRARPRTDGHEALRVLTVLAACQESLGHRLPAPGPLDRHPTPYTCHETSIVEAGAEVGAGTVIWHFSRILSGSRVGRNCRIGQNVVIGPDVHVGNGVKIQNNVSVYTGVTLEDDVFCGPSMVFTNVLNPRSALPRRHQFIPTRVRRGATLGANCTVVCGVTIGQYAFVGAGAVVTREVPDHALVVGNPARRVGWMCQCGRRLAFPAASGAGAATCHECGRGYRQTGAGVEPT